MGEDGADVEGLVFVDRARGRWFWGLNVEGALGFSGDEAEIEIAAVGAYSFIDATSAGLSSSTPGQSFVPALTLEVVSESAVKGPDTGTAVQLIPGLSIWNPRSGWTVGFGFSLPATNRREADRAFLFRISNHLGWPGRGE